MKKLLEMKKCDIAYLISETDAKAEKDTANDEHGNIFGTTINGTTEKEDKTTQHDGVSTTQGGRDATSYERSE